MGYEENWLEQVRNCPQQEAADARHEEEQQGHYDTDGSSVSSQDISMCTIPTGVEDAADACANPWDLRSLRRPRWLFGPLEIRPAAGGWNHVNRCFSPDLITKHR